MLNYLKVENLAVVEKAELSFSPRLNVLTGETGAGKSILIDAIRLFLHKKYPLHIIRNPEKKVVVEALFSREDEEFLLRREIEENRSLGFVNGQVTPFLQMRELAFSYLNIYGQKDHIFLLSSANQQNFLDEYSKNEELLKQIAEMYRVIRSKMQCFQEMEKKKGAAQNQMAEIAFFLNEIEQLHLSPDEEDKLREQTRLLTAAETILQKCDLLLQDFYQSERSVYHSIARNRPHLDYLSDMFPEFRHYAEEIQRSYRTIPEMSTFLDQWKSKLDFDENELNRIEQKLQKVERLKAKYELDLPGLLKRYEEKKEEMASLINLDFSLQDQAKEIDDLLSRYNKLQHDLRTSRKKNGEILSQQVVAELSKLEMKKSRFSIKIHEAEPSRDNLGEKGTDEVEFYFSSNPGQDPAPLADVASGGELSRLMLVFKSLLQNEKDTTYIFDEIDSGIGGKTAEFVGEKLRQISQTNQVICISHLPQIASFAECHFRITKEFKKNQTFSTAAQLQADERVQEIARLMAGSAINESVVKAAEELLRLNSR